MQNVITQDTLAGQITDQLGRTPLNKTQVNLVLEEMKKVIAENLKKGSGVRLTGFGTFEPFLRHARGGVNPQTLERIEMPEVLVAKFRTGKGLRDYLKIKEPATHYDKQTGETD